MLFFKKRKKNKKEDIYLEPEFDDKELPASDKAFKEYELIEQMQYVRTQCEQITDSTKYISELKAEHQIVNNYISDMQIIENQDEVNKRSLRSAAAEIVKLKSQRENIRNGAPLISSSRYSMFEQYDNDFPDALTNFINDEKYCQKVKHDMRALEAEKLSIQEDMKDFDIRRVNVRNISIISLLGIVAVFMIFIVSGQLNSDNGIFLFMIVLLLATFFVLLVCLLMRNTTYKIKYSEKKLSRAITLLNKVKIKYVNIVNSVDYQKSKYKVQNSLELSKEYEAYLVEKKKAEKYRNSAVELNEAIDNFNDKLARLNLYDSAIWEKQAEALNDEKAMKEIRHTLNERRTKLREQIDYNMERIEEAKNGVLRLVKKNPELTDEIMGIMDSYNLEL